MTKAKALLWVRDFFIVGFIVFLVLGAPYVFAGTAINTSIDFRPLDDMLAPWMRENFWNLLGLIGFAAGLAIVATRKQD